MYGYIYIYILYDITKYKTIQTTNIIWIFNSNHVYIYIYMYVYIYMSGTLTSLNNKRNIIELRVYQFIVMYDWITIRMI